MSRPALAFLLVCCGLLLGIVSGVGVVAGQDGTAERTLNATSVSPGGTVEVTVTAELGEAGSVDFADTWSPRSAQTEIVSTSFDRGGFGVAGPTEVALFSQDDVPAGTIEIVYTITVPEETAPGTVYEWEPAEDGDGSILSLADDNVPIGGDQQFTVVDDSTDDGSDDGSGDGSTDDGSGDDGGGDGSTDDGSGDDSTDDGSGDDGGSDGSGPGFGFVAAVFAGVALAVHWMRRSDSS